MLRNAKVSSDSTQTHPKLKDMTSFNVWQFLFVEQRIEAERTRFSQNSETGSTVKDVGMLSGRVISSSASRHMLGFGSAHSALGTCHLSLENLDENIHTKISIL